MDIDIVILLLLPVFFGFGWLAARIDMRAVLKQAMSVPSGFLRALGALVDDKTDVAAAALGEAVRQHPGAFELQSVLGRLYRKRGENDLAIMLHQQMLDSADLPTEYRDKVCYELAQDFRQAGLVDRAESILLTLQSGNKVLAARKDLLAIYQQDRDWQNAINIAKTLGSDTHSFATEIAQFHCELAQSALYKSRFPEAKSQMDNALSVNRKCVRATILMGDLAFEQGYYKEAIAIWQGVEKQNYEYLSMVVERLFDAYEKLERSADGLALLKGYLKSFSQLDILDVLYQKVAVYEGEAQALELVREQAHEHPSLLGVYRLLCARSVYTRSPDKQSDVQLARDVLSRQVQRVVLHHCRCCHFRSRTFFWHCPACGAWECFTPNRSEV